MIKPDTIPGYKTMMVDGFTLLVHEKVLDPKNSEMFKVKPLEVLDMELKMISAVLAPSLLHSSEISLSGSNGMIN